MKEIRLSPTHSIRYPDSGVPLPTSNKITQLAFLNRFTDDEAVDIDLASVGNTREAALLRRYLQKVAAATFIDLSREDLADDLGKLVAFGLLSQEKVTTILSAPIQEHEKFKE